MVFVDGKKIGTTNGENLTSGWLEIPSGSRVVELRRDQYITYRNALVVAPGQRVDIPAVKLEESGLINLTIRGSRGGYRVEITDMDAKNSIPPRLVTSTAISFPLRPGTYSVKVTADKTVKERMVQISTATGPVVFDLGDFPKG
jgi:hypothetical protein